MRRRLGTLLLTALASATLTTAVVLPSPASASDVLGNDISWPQCTEKPGHGLPLPRAGTGFAIVGLTSGLPFTENPCIERQLAHVSAIGARLGAYSFAAMPTGQQVRTYGTAGPFDTTTRVGQLANTGYAQGLWSASVLQAHAMSVPMVWLDVEARKRQPWGSNPVENVAVLQGATKALQDKGFSVGYYSYLYGWNQITGGLRSPLPVWATAGRRGRSAAAAMCSQPSFSGGPVLVAQWYDDVRDSDIACPVLSQGTSLVRDELAPFRTLRLRRGSHGPAVSALRRRLGMPESPVYSRATALAVRHFQAGKHLTVDGVVGPATWRALGAGQLRAGKGGAGWDRYFGRVAR